MGGKEWPLEKQPVNAKKVLYNLLVLPRPPVLVQKTDVVKGFWLI